MVERRRRVFIVFILALIPLAGAVYELFQPTSTQVQTTSVIQEQQHLAIEKLEMLDIKGRAPKTDYSRDKFGDGWAESNGCDTRNFILKRDMTEVIIDQQNMCYVLSGKLNDPYTGKIIDFKRGAGTSDQVQIDHVVPLSDAWQKGAQYWDENKRLQFANDSLELLAVDGPANQQKSDGDAATWLPPNKDYRCRYVARQIAVKVKYAIWVTKAEYDAMKRTLSRCPAQSLPVMERNDV